MSEQKPYRLYVVSTALFDLEAGSPCPRCGTKLDASFDGMGYGADDPSLWCPSCEATVEEEAR